jgi:hypothetical protein
MWLVLQNFKKFVEFCNCSLKVLESNRTGVFSISTRVCKSQGIEPYHFAKSRKQQFLPTNDNPHQSPRIASKRSDTTAES